MKHSTKTVVVLSFAALAAGACGGGFESGDDTGGAGSTMSPPSGGSGGMGGGGAPTAGGHAGSASAGRAGSNSTVGGTPAAGSGSGGMAQAGSSSAGAASGGSANGGTSSGGTGGSAGAAGSAGAGGGTTCTVSPIDPSATAEAKKLLCYLYSINGTKVLSGQQETSWSNPQADIDYYVTTVGKHPAILGGDYLYQDGAKPGSNSTKRAVAYWNAGGITMMRYHMGAPPLADTYENSKLSVANFDNLYTEGTSENTSLKSKLDYMASELKYLQDNNVPVLLVPYHEIDQFPWFWWSKGTGPQFVKLWKYTLDYVTKTKGVHNAIWMVGYAHDGALADYWPGKAFADLGGIDQYDQGKQPFKTQYDSTKAVVGPSMPIPLHETGTIPQPADMFPTTAPWVLWNVWAGYQNTAAEGYTWNTADSIKKAYADSRTVTRETLPSLK